MLAKFASDRNTLKKQYVVTALGNFRHWHAMQHAQPAQLQLAVHSAGNYIVADSMQRKFRIARVPKRYQKCNDKLIVQQTLSAQITGLDNF